MAGLVSAEAPSRVGGSNPLFFFCGRMDCSRACHRARIRATRWLAMTINLLAIDLGSRTGQRPASTSAMKRSTISLNSAGSSRLSTWPDFGKHREPRCRKVLLQEQARLDAGVVLVAADDQRRRRDASGSRRSGCRSRAGRPGSCAWCWPNPWRHGGPARCRSRRARAGPSAGTESGSAPRASLSPLPPSRSCHTARHWPGTAGGRSRDFRGSSRSRRRRASSTARAPGAFRPTCSDE